MKRLFLKSLILITCLCGHVNELTAKKILIKNESNWNLSVRTQGLGFQLVLRPGQTHRITTEQPISIKPYGDFKGRIGYILLEEKIVQPAATNDFDTPLILIKTEDTQLPEEQSEEPSWLKWTLEKASNVASTLTEGAQKITGTQPYIVQTMSASTYDLPTLHELLSQAIEPRYFLKLSSGFKLEEVAAASKSLIEDNINSLPNGTLKNTLVTLADSATEFLYFKPKNAIRQWEVSLGKAHKALRKKKSAM